MCILSLLMSKILFRLGLNTAIGLILVIFWLKSIGLKTVLEEISLVSPISLAPFLLFFIIANIARALRLKLLLSGYKLKLTDLMKLNYLNQLLSFTIPIRVGEVARAVYLSGSTKEPFTKTLIWVFLDRFIDFFVIISLALVLLSVIPTSLPANFTPILISTVTTFGFFAYLFIYQSNLAKKIITLISHIFILKILKKLFIRISEFIIDSSSLLRRNPKDLLLILLITIVAVTADALSWYIIFKAIFKSIDLLTTYLGFLLSALTYMIPAAPGYVGSAEGLGLAVFSFGLGFDKNLTSAGLILMHGLTFICILIFGLTSLYLLKFDLKSVWEKIKRK